MNCFFTLNMECSDGSGLYSRSATLSIMTDAIVFTLMNH
jgi:hypothetical protein